MDALTADERAAIDAALAAGRVTKVPQGASSALTYGYVDGKLLALNADGAPMTQDEFRERQRAASASTAKRFEIGRRAGARKAAEGAANRQKVADAFEGGARSVAALIAATGMADPTIRKHAKSLGLTFERRRAPEGGDALAERKVERQERGRAKVRDRRRFKTGPVPGATDPVRASAAATGTIFPTTVETPTPTQTVLKDGANSSKIGGDVLVGWLKGARILTLTLEERATCPPCAVAEICYGNRMQYAQRWRAGPEVEDAIRREIEAACATHERVLVRLHVLGDFYSFDYLRLWTELLDEFDNLNVFGFTAHAPDTEIGAGIARVRAALGRRFSIRHSGITGQWGAFTIDFPTERSTLGDALVCPEQRGAWGDTRERHCGDCGACWTSDRPIVFAEH